MRIVAWYKEWFGTEYLELYAHRNQGRGGGAHRLCQPRSLVANNPRAVLDLACGAGRHTAAALRSRGIRALGVDLSLTLLIEPPRLPSVAAGHVLSALRRRAAFDWVLNFFTSFGYFENEEENLQVLREIFRVLSPGGRCLVDLFIRDKVVANLVPHEQQRASGLRCGDRALVR